MNPKIITLKFDNKVVTVEKLTLRKTAEVFKALDELPKRLSGIAFDMSNDQFLAILPNIIADVLPEIAKIIAIGSSLTEEEVLDTYGLAEAVEVLTAIFQVNDFSKMADSIKKLMARKPVSANSKPTIGSTGP